jgi:hypothetical protein
MNADPSETSSVQPNQIIFGVLLVVALLGLAFFFSWRQWLALKHLREATNLSPEDQLYTRRQIRRRLLCSVLMVVLAGMLAGHFALEERANDLANLRGANPNHVFAPEEEQFLRFYWNYWIILLLVLLAIITIAGFDFFAIRRYGQRHYRKIQADRRAMIEGELARIRSQRNGHD